MEGDLNGKLSASLMFDFEDEIHLIDNPLSQAHPDNQVPTVWNLSLEHTEQGSSTESNPPRTSIFFEQNLIGIANITNIDHSDPSPKTAPNIALPSRSSVESDSIIGTPQCPQGYYQTTEISTILQPLVGENNLPQFDRVNTNPSLLEQAHTTQESTNQPPINALNELVTSCFNTPFSGAPHPYLPATTRLGIVNGRSHLNQQPSTRLPDYQNAPYPPLNPSRPQLLPYHLNQVQLASNLQNSQVPTLPVSRPQYQPNQVPLPTNLPSQPLMLPGIQQLPNHEPINKPLQLLPNMFNPQGDNSLLLDPSMTSRTQSPEQQGLLNQTARPSVTYPSPDSSQLSQVLNSSNQQRALRRRSRYEVGESSSAPKRPRRDSAKQENAPQVSVSQSKENGRDNSDNVSRPMKNSLYDPLFESIGQPVDPHLRRFAMK
ncbi:hypothetical protein Ddye_006190 [Dipteronia dyeriana]|uniref:Uncharacterized protein n=1 Tax=Dipteronia dyeriana TaxID=168575 RepID=A0AAD9XI44_9ROSI|nr:hypothetical protein Ddye_006190 [Dipteronia dyeriana]